WLESSGFTQELFQGLTCHFNSVGRHAVVQELQEHFLQAFLLDTHGDPLRALCNTINGPTHLCQVRLLYDRLLHRKVNAGTSFSSNIKPLYAKAFQQGYNRLVVLTETQPII